MFSIVEPIPVLMFVEHVETMHTDQNSGFKEQFEVCWHGNDLCPLFM